MNESLVSSLSRSIERWSRAGARAWIGRGLLAGACFGAPCLLIPIVGGPAILALPLTLGGTSALLAWTRRWWWKNPTGPARVWPMVCVTTTSLVGPLMVSMLVAAPMWRVDRTRPLPSPPSVAQGYWVDLEDAPLFVIGLTITRGEERELVRAPLGLFGCVVREAGRARLVSDHGLGDYVVPLSEEGERLDDDALSRVLARLDLGGGIPIASLVVVAALIALLAMSRLGSELSRFAWLGLTTFAFLVIAWGF